LNGPNSDSYTNGCLIPGVTSTGITTKTVTRIDWSSKSLNGSLPESLYTLTNLTVLGLSYNRLLSGSISSSIGNLKQLTQLFFNLHNIIVIKIEILRSIT